MFRDLIRPLFKAPFRAPDDESGTGGAPPGGTDPQPPQGGGQPAPAKWYETVELAEEERQWLSSRGLNEDDPLKVLPKLVKGHRSAEQRIGRGMDSILDKPAKDQKLGDWMRQNAATFGLPDSDEGYGAAQPDFWPKEMPWDAELEASARKLAFENGIPPEAHKAYVDLFAKKMQAYGEEADRALDAAKADMMAELERDHGTKAPAVLAGARQAAQHYAEKAGLGGEELNRVMGVLADKVGDAGVIRFMNAIRADMGEDAGVGLGRGGGLTMSAAEAKAELARFEGPEGEYGKAFAAGDARRLADLRARRDQLAKIAVGP